MGSSTLSLPAPQSARFLKLAAGAAVGMLLLIPVAIAIHAGVYDSAVDNPLMGWGMWGAFVIYLSLRPGRARLAATVGIGLALRLLYDLAVGERGYWGSAVIGMGVFLGVACVLVLAAQSLGPASEFRGASRRALLVIGLISYMGVFLAFYITFAKLVLPSKLDYFLYNFDGTLGLQASFAVARFVQGRPALERAMYLVYDCLGFWFPLVYAVHARHRLRYPVSLVKLLILNAAIGFSLYFLFPAMGPRYAFQAFPKLPGAVTIAPAFLSGVPNAMPSLHFATALLMYWMAGPWKWLSRITGLFLVLTALATLGLGEHYLIDLVVAVPYSLAIFALSSKTPESRRALLAGAAMVLVWIAFLRIGHYHFVAGWVGVLATLAISLTLKRKLAASAFQAGPQRAATSA